MPRIARDGSGLPSPRSVSLGVHKDSDKPHSHLIALSAIWAQFISHDITHTPQMKGHQGSQLKCCQVPFEHFHPECYPIRLPEGDPYYGHGETCQEYVRSSTAPRIGCTLGPREQINQQTSFLDGSQIYGTSKKTLESLRLFQGGLLRAQLNHVGEELLPSESNLTYCRSNSLSLRLVHMELKFSTRKLCLKSQNKIFNLHSRCFKSGDDRVNENVGLASLHQLFLREHNRIARELAALNPHFTDEVLFQETRRIVGAELQHVC